MTDSSVDLESILNTLQSSLIAPTRTASLLPSPSDLSFERTLSRSLARSLDSQSASILSLAQNLLDWAQPEGTPEGGKKRVELDGDLIRDGDYSIIERVEKLLEHADDQIEKHLGVGKHKKSGTGGVVGAKGAKSFEEMQEKEKMKQKLERLPAKLLHDSSLPKPQLLFTSRTKIEPQTLEEEEGIEGIPLWKPILSTKLNALDEEAHWLQTEVYEPTSKFTIVTDTTPPSYTRYVHPYKSELEQLVPSKSLLDLPKQPPAAIPKDSFEKTPFEWVGDKGTLERMVEEIRKIGEEEEGLKELAVDLEHHDFRSWSGFTCLIQLSTRKKDYVIDAINPEVRDSLEVLNEFFTDPTWIKVLHGANSDIVWLQRDFGLYIVGLFDTYHATHVLGYNQHSLASLLEMYTDFEPDKRYQLADWRIRPLPKEMLHYARSDTHYLLTIYDHLRLALSSKPHSSSSSSEELSPLSEVFHRSTSVSSTVFSLPPYDHLTGHFDSGFLIPLSKSGQLKSYATALSVPTLPIKTSWGPGEFRLEVLRELMRWREGVARELDESTRFVMSLQGVLQVVEQAKRITQGGGSNELVRVLGGTRGGISEIVRKRKEDLVELIKETIEKVQGTTMNAAGDEEMEVDGEGLAALSNGVPSFEPVVRAVKGLWEEENKVKPVASTSNSSFFGTTTQPRQGGEGSGSKSSSLIAPSSSFFGASSTKPKRSNGKGKQVERKPSSLEERLAAVQKVHESLVLGGGLAKSLQPHSIPTPIVAESSAATAPQPSTSVDPSLMPVPLPLPDDSFLSFDSSSSSSKGPKAIGSTSHSTQSTEAMASEPKDSEVIVVSSLKDKPSRSSQAAQAKKRRRTVTDSTQPSETSASASTSSAAVSPPPQPPQAKKQKKKKNLSTSEEPPIVPHDYSQSTSILDAGPSILTGLERREAEKKQKKKDKAAQGGSGKGPKLKVDTSEFKRPMRVNNAPKSAAVSKTFAK
ncbi:exosome nuclease subunit RRP6 [Sporobolomyces salmoneus]|uniref:exosome nuclease subunit RRP6 n=1 Tax=Sporobolomyces salmoneus TaxID=183962 RepID=UPI00316F2B7B